MIRMLVEITASVLLVCALLSLAGDIHPALLIFLAGTLIIGWQFYERKETD